MSESSKRPNWEHIAIGSVSNHAIGVEYTRDAFLLPVAVVLLFLHKVADTALDGGNIRTVGGHQCKKRPGRIDD